MKTKLIIGVAILFATIYFTSCEDKDDNKRPAPKNGEEFTNQWIYDEMKELYLWCDKLPESPDWSLDPETFFESILFDRDQINGDRFSFMSEDESKTKSATSNHLGFDVILKQYFDFNRNPQNAFVGFVVANVREGSNAQTKGLKRGHVIYAVNGSEINNENYADLYYSLQSAGSISLSVYNENGERVSINDIQGYAYDSENPVWLSKIIEDNGKKIGYIVYNQFEMGDDSEYDVKMIEAIDTLTKKHGVKDMIIDLRYNPGGYVMSAAYIASALVPNRVQSNVFQKYAYNEAKQDELSKKYGSGITFFDNIVNEDETPIYPIPKTNLNSLYFLATENSASASEALINGLKPYMAVKHIGTKTTGKDKGSWELTNKDEQVKWTYNPLIFRVQDKNGDGGYITGLSPYITRDEWNAGYFLERAQNSNNEVFDLPDLTSYSQQVNGVTTTKHGLTTLGDPSEPLLKTALDDLAGRAVSNDAVVKSTKSTPIKVRELRPLRPSRMIVNPKYLQ